MRTLPEKWIVHLATAVLLTLFLAYIDEGYYTFNWMLDLDNWIAFILYVALFWAFLLLISKGVARIVKGSLQEWFSTFTGSILTFLFVIFIVATIV